MDEIVDSATPGSNQGAGLFRSNQVSSFEYAERRAALAAKIGTCVARAFHAIGASSATQEIVYWNLSVTKNFARNEIALKPEEFIEGLREIYGEAGTKVFEYMLSREIRREFNLSFPVLEGGEGRSEALDLIRYIMLEG